MRPGRETLLLVAGAFLCGTLVTLLTHEFWHGGLGFLLRGLIVGVTAVLALALFLLWWWLSGRDSGDQASNSTTTLEKWEKTHPAERQTPPEPASSKGSVGARELGGTNSRLDPPPASAGGGRPPAAGWPAAEPPWNPVWPAGQAVSPPSQAQTGFGGDSYADPVSRADSSRLVDLWDVYLRSGNRFNEAGLRRQLSSSLIDAEVIHGSQFGGGDNVLAVDLKDGSGLLYLLPDFAKPPRAIEEWFQASDSGSRMARIQKLVRPATVRKSGGKITLESKGAVE